MSPSSFQTVTSACRCENNWPAKRFRLGAGMPQRSRADRVGLRSGEVHFHGNWVAVLNLWCHSAGCVWHARGWYAHGVRTVRGLLGKLPCAFGTYSTQEAGTRTPYIVPRPRAVRVSLVLDRHLRHGLVVRLAPRARHPVRVLIVGRPGGRPRRAQRRTSHSWSRRPRAFDVGPEKLAASEEPRDRLHTVRDVRVPAASWRQSKHRHEALHLLRLHICPG